MVHCSDTAAADDDDKPSHMPPAGQSKRPAGIESDSRERMIHRKEIAAKRRATNLEDVSEDKAFLRERIAILEERLQAEKKYAEHLEAQLARLNESDDS